MRFTFSERRRPRRARNATNPEESPEARDEFYLSGAPLKLALGYEVESLLLTVDAIPDNIGTLKAGQTESNAAFF